MQILFLSRWYPYPPTNGSKIRIYNLLRGLAQRHEVTLLSFAERPQADPVVSELHNLCQEMHTVTWKSFNPHSQRARLGFLSLTPRSMVDTFSSEMRQRIIQTLSENDYDIIIASEIDMAIYSRYFNGAPALLDELQVGILYEQFARASSPWHRLRYGLTWTKYRRFLASILRNFGQCIVASNRERQLLAKAVPAYRAIEVVPNCVNLTSYGDIQETAQSNSLIFTGSFSFNPNYEGMDWFLREIYPLIQNRVPDVTLTITGDHAGRPLPMTGNVELTGFVNDVRPLIARSWSSVVPLHTGGGTRLKILEAMALHTPVIATSKGAEGLDAQAGRHLLIADTPEAFALATVRLLQEPGLREELAENAYQLVRAKYDWEVVMPRFLDAVEEVAQV